MTRRRWIADSWDQATASLKDEQAAHLIRVLRGRPGMEFDVVAGGRVWRAAVASLTDDIVRFTLLAEVEANRALPLTMLLSIFKFDRMEWILEKGTELGVERFTPMIAERSEKHLAQAAQGRVERWRRIAREAAQQSRRSDLPVVDDPVPLRDAVRGERHGRQLRLLLSEEERLTTLRMALEQSMEQAAPPKEVQETAEQIAGDEETVFARVRRELAVAVAVGPEGGWTAKDEALFAAEGWRPVSLGPRILRAETAGIVAAAVVAVWLE
jgi:16S rRNA (uracil1498-N3)-methyltransferase